MRVPDQGLSIKAPAMKKTDHEVNVDSESVNHAMLSDYIISGA